MKIGLALSGGGILGMAHLGLLKELESNKIKIDMIAGTSIGAMAGGLYAAGGAEKIEEFLELFEKRRSSSKQVLSFLSDNFLEIAKKTLTECLGDATFADLKTKFICTATDLSDGSLSILDKGGVVDAIMASCAYPGLLPVQKIGEKYYIDGGIVCNFPVNILRQHHIDYIIGSSLYNIDRMTDEELERLIKNKDELSARAHSLVFRTLAQSEYESCDICFTYPLEKFNWLNIDHMHHIKKIGDSHAKDNIKLVLAGIKSKKKTF